MLTALSSLCLCRPLRTSLFFSTQNLLRTPISSSSTSLHIWSCTSSSSTQIQIAPANVEQSTGVPKVEILKQKLELLGIVCDSSCVPGHYSSTVRVDMEMRIVLISVIWDAMIPCILLALGGNLINGPGSSKLGFRTTAAIIFARLVLVPPAGPGIVTLADKLGFLPDDLKSCTTHGSISSTHESSLSLLGQPMTKKVEKQCCHFYSVEICESEARAGLVCQVHSSDRSKFMVQCCPLLFLLIVESLLFLGFPVYRLDHTLNSVSH
ncbi:hypothetical protein ACLB2K_016033 [Fragaria x ananassa]